MKKTPPAANPDAYVAALDGWRAKLVKQLRSQVLAAADLAEDIKWGHLVYFNNGPVLLIRAEDERVLFGFWRGAQLIEIEPRLNRGGKYEMATLEFRDGVKITAAIVKQLACEATTLNQRLGDPTKLAKKVAASPTAKPRAAKKR